MEQASDANSDAPSAHEPSPNASIQPAPFDQADELFARSQDDAGTVDAGATTGGTEAPPTPLREDVGIPVDVLEEKEIFGNELEAVFIWHDVPALLMAPDLDMAALNALKERSALALEAHTTTADRASFVLASPTFPLGSGVELRARRDHYGYVLVWPNQKSYRPVPPGALRALLGERRADVIALVPGTSAAKARGKALGFQTAITSISSPFGSLELEQAEIPGLARSGSLLCRLLVELVGVEPSTLACDDRQVPLRAEYRWKDGGKLSFVVKKLGRRRPYDPKEIAAPPSDAQFTPGLMPAVPEQRMDDEELGRMRRQPAAAAGDGDNRAATRGLVARNTTPILSAVLVNGIPVAWIAPGEEQRISGLKRGKYAVAFRDFLGESCIPARPTDVPGHAAPSESPEASTAAAQ